MAPIEIELHKKIAAKFSSYPPRFSLPDYRVPPTSLEPYILEEKFLFAYHKVLPAASKARCDDFCPEEKFEHMLSELWVLICHPALLEARSWDGWLYTSLCRNTWAWANQAKYWANKRPASGKSLRKEQLSFATTQPLSLTALEEALTALEKAFRLLCVSESRGSQYSKEYRGVIAAHQDTLDQLSSDAEEKLIYRQHRNRRNYLARLVAA